MLHLQNLFFKGHARNQIIRPLIDRHGGVAINRRRFAGLILRVRRPDESANHGHHDQELKGNFVCNFAPSHVHNLFPIDQESMLDHLSHPNPRRGLIK